MSSRIHQVTVATLFSLSTLPLVAAEPNKSEDTELQEIVVTATRQQTNLQDTPIAITAVTSEELAKRSIVNVADLGAIIPNAAFRQAQGAYGKGVTAYIRNIGQGDTNLASEPGVAYYIDDVYYPLLFGSNFDLLDLDQVEVVRGPQGTLFGRNALAGAVSLVSKAPDPAASSAYAEVTAGSFDRQQIRGGINLPLGDTAALRVSAVSKRRVGYQDRLDFRCEMIRRGTPQLAGNFPFAEGNLINTGNFTPDNCVIGHLGGEDVHAARAQLLWKVTPKLSLTFGGDWLEDESESAADSLVAVNAAAVTSHPSAVAAAATFTAPGGPTFAYDQRFLTGDPYTTYATYGDPVSAGAVIPVTTGTPFYDGSVTHGGFRYRPYAPVKNWGVSSRAVYEVTDDIALTAVFGYRKVDTLFSFDVDGSPLALENTRNNTGEDYKSGEVRLAGKTGPVDWVGGVFFYRGDGHVHTTLVSPFLGLQRYQNHSYSPKSDAAFVNLTWHPLDRLGVTLGGRLSDDKNVVHYSNLQDEVPANNVIFDVTPKDNRFDWKAGLDYKLLTDTMVYASAATGFRLPSFNSRPYQPSQITQIPGDEILNYELGSKSEFLDKRLRLNATAFFTDYKTRPASIGGQEYQNGASGPIAGNSVTIPLVNGPPGSTTCRLRTTAEVNAGTPGFTCVSRTYYYNEPGRVRGLEAEVEALPVTHLSITGSFGYSTFDSHDINLPTRVNKRLLGVPQWNASGGVQYELPVAELGGSIVPRIDWLYTGSIAYQTGSTSLNQSAYSVFNARITYNNNSHDIDVSLGATNVFNKFYYQNIFDLQPFGYPQTNGQPSRPREWFVSIRKNF
ncbi:MAG: TonB-dependent receptor [Pseudomonadota bacterium]